jgi:hypothetical protein
LNSPQQMVWRAKISGIFVLFDERWWEKTDKLSSAIDYRWHIIFVEDVSIDGIPNWGTCAQDQGTWWNSSIALEVQVNSLVVGPSILRIYHCIVFLHDFQGFISGRLDGETSETDIRISMKFQIAIHTIVVIIR